LNTAENISRKVRRRRIVQWCLLPIVVLTIGLGWKYPMLGFSVPMVMLIGMIGGVFRGRYVCGNLCPRGAFFDRIMTRISRNSAIPQALRNKTLRWMVFAALMGFMIFRLARNPTSTAHWGQVFWLMCVVTTGIGLVLGIFIHPRAWCAFCPIGTVQMALGGKKHLLEIDTDECRECSACEKACPFSLAIVKHRAAGHVNDPDCLKCSECVAVCPKHALSWPSRKK
jgi:ferredoxin-type protein NapH